MTGILYLRCISRRLLRNFLGPCACVFAVGLLPFPATSSQNRPPSYTGDHSDWWSYTGQLESDTDTQNQNREPSPANFQILGLKLDDDIFTTAAVKIGKAAIEQRGDGAAGRSQVCHASSKGPEKIHLIFEKGEVNDAFYLFENGPDWIGSDLCAESNLITKHISVASGLHLGLTRGETREILGKPSAVAGDKLIYSFMVDKKTSAADLANLRRRHPALSEKELHANYASYSLGVYIELRFSSGRLSYLAVSKSETY